jgi:hypothetical protein
MSFDDWLVWSTLLFFTLNSSTMRTARSRTSGEYLLDVFITPSSQRLESPVKPVWFIMASEHVSDEEKERLKTVHQTLNPFILKKNIEKKLRVIFKNVKVTSNVRQRI